MKVRGLQVRMLTGGFGTEGEGGLVVNLPPRPTVLLTFKAERDHALNHQV